MAFRNRSQSNDMQRYREGYPGMIDHPKWNKNLEFYSNRIPSAPHGDMIDNILHGWAGDYELLERDHGYIQWLFPIRDQGMNSMAQPLQQHEANAIAASPHLLSRVWDAYNMMLGFYGLEAVDPQTGAVRRAINYRERYSNLIKNAHNTLRITRMFKSLGELGMEQRKWPLLHLLAEEIFGTLKLKALEKPFTTHWVETIRDNTTRQEMKSFVKQLKAGNPSPPRPDYIKYADMALASAPPSSLEESATVRLKAQEEFHGLNQEAALDDKPEGLLNGIRVCFHETVNEGDRQELRRMLAVGNALREIREEQLSEVLRGIVLERKTQRDDLVAPTGASSAAAKKRADKENIIDTPEKLKEHLAKRRMEAENWQNATERVMNEGGVSADSDPSEADVFLLAGPLAATRPNAVRAFVQRAISDALVTGEEPPKVAAVFTDWIVVTHEKGAIADPKRFLVR